MIAETIAGKLGIETKSITTEEAPQYLGFLAAFADLDKSDLKRQDPRAAGVGSLSVQAGSRT